jgi:hypothetical protein
VAEMVSNVVFVTDVCAGTYSGGNKRKLSTAIALIGEVKTGPAEKHVFLLASNKETHEKHFLCLYCVLSISCKMRTVFRKFQKQQKFSIKKNKEA